MPVVSCSRSDGCDRLGECQRTLEVLVGLDREAGAQADAVDARVDRVEDQLVLRGSHDDQPHRQYQADAEGRQQDGGQPEADGAGLAPTCFDPEGAALDRHGDDGLVLLVEGVEGEPACAVVGELPLEERERAAGHQAKVAGEAAAQACLAESRTKARGQKSHGFLQISMERNMYIL